ncbi:hypothetical protein GMST_29280 [Geomonas silvestris]|uniref:Carrier domain-containing protein n=1 Tax=Geomonas silvestris TaxID=2740184 RepID=A0A6V8MLI2_9BACT|nr:acyl carrier protein [Geomonas silvestris]GFO60603.1 hypothetical protein GMST_29280 [Geomonas silvestris]
MDLKAHLNDLCLEVLGADLDQSVPAMAAGLTWDTLAYVRLVVAIERRFGIAFSPKELLTIENVEDLLDCIRSKIAA